MHQVLLNLLSENRTEYNIIHCFIRYTVKLFILIFFNTTVCLSDKYAG